jgi:hypothetical protein
MTHTEVSRRAFASFELVRAIAEAVKAAFEAGLSDEEIKNALEWVTSLLEES